MSHELRTPLNSILVLGQQLAENPDGNLSGKQVEFARTIHGAGTDLLNLISDILDLSKIESGTVSVEAEEVYFNSLIEMVARPFKHEADNRRLAFDIVADPRLARSIVTDSKRLQQVLKNLLSNAFKFTEQGKVQLLVSVAGGGWTQNHPILSASGTVVAFSVTDTGIGIPLEKQRIIFEAFQQADAGTSRKFGGTGLGLAISRELASLLGGEIQLFSTPGQGSTFTLYLPQTYAGPATASTVSRGEVHIRPVSFPPVPIASVAEHLPERIEDDRAELAPGDEVLLIVEDDPHYARLVCDLSRDKGFKVLHAATGSEALALAKEYRPTAISLDVFLPDMLGWTVLNHLKQDPTTRHIPVQMLTSDDDWHHGLSRGAFAFVSKPTTTEGLSAAITRIKAYATPRRKRLLVVEDEKSQQLSIEALLGSDDIDVAFADTGTEALAAVTRETYDCLVLDLRLPDMSGFEVLERLRDTPSLSELPVVVFTGKDLSPEENNKLHSLARSVIVKDVESPERLLDETSLFLHRVVADLPIDKQNMLDRLHRSDEALVGKQVLIVDDDVRNIFALSSVLERRGMTVMEAGTGREAIETIEKTPGLGIVLMDIMMPEMDGLTAMREIRRRPELKKVPIIALTAKAMKDDQDKCLAAGANDYIAKPLDVEKLLSLVRVWMPK
jgi:CheY-like chemotaxis protein/two-component sensor histidine kinase